MIDSCNASASGSINWIDGLAWWTAKPEPDFVVEKRTPLGVLPCLNASKIFPIKIDRYRCIPATETFDFA